MAALRLLTVEAVRDAARRRVVLAVLVLCFLCLTTLDRCTSCNASIDLRGDIAQSVDVLGWAGMAVFCVLALWTVTLAGLLASDHLSESLDDGSARLVLARPVARDTFALSRLAGSLLVSLAAAVIVLGGASFFLSTRNALPLAPAVVATVACILSAIAVASLAMTASLYLPRIATMLFVITVVTGFSLLNLASLSGIELRGLYGVLDQLGPPLASSIAVALAPWSGRIPENADVLSVALRLVLWAAGGVALLVSSFRRYEIT